MSNERRRKPSEFEQLTLTLDYAFNRGVDLANRTIQLTEDIEDHHFDHFDTAMSALESLNRKAITLKINSYGGDVYTALGIIGRMRESKCQIITKGYGKIMSACTAILAAGDKRSMSILAEFMHHESSYSVEGRHSEIQHEVKQAQTLSDRWCNLMSDLTGVPSTYWSSRGVGKDFYMSAEKCLELNIVDEVF